MKTKPFCIYLLLTMALVLTIHGQVSAFPGDSDPGDLLNHFDMRGNVLVNAGFNEVAVSDVNPHNILGLPESRYEALLRPDFYFTLHDQRIFLECKPRWAISQTAWDDGIYQLKSAQGRGEVYINEWLVKFGVTQRFFLSGGRENVQWGPSSLLSPSNPFYRDNGRNNPYLELPGLDYARAVFVPGGHLSLSLIANVGDGRRESTEPFQNTYALKMDVTGDKKYAGMISSKREKDKPVLGFFGGITVTDYLLLHTEASWSFESEKADVLVGGSYTLLDGSALSLEYFHQGAGCDKEPIERCVVSEDFYDQLQERFTDYEGTLEELLQEIEALNLNIDTGALIRKNYLMVQYVKPRILDALTLTGRWIVNADDRSSRMIGIANWEITDHLAFHLVGNVFTGSSDSEYGALLNHAVMTGITVYF